MSTSWWSRNLKIDRWADLFRFVLADPNPHIQARNLVLLRLLLNQEPTSEHGAASSQYFVHCTIPRNWEPEIKEKALNIYKGQLISKANFKVFIWTKKPTKIFLYFCPSHIVRNSIWKKKNQASDNVGKFRTYLNLNLNLNLIWIHHLKSIS